MSQKFSVCSPSECHVLSSGVIREKLSVQCFLHLALLSFWVVPTSSDCITFDHTQPGSQSFEQCLQRNLMFSPLHRCLLLYSFSHFSTSSFRFVLSANPAEYREFRQQRRITRRRGRTMVFFLKNTEWEKRLTNLVRLASLERSWLNVLTKCHRNEWNATIFTKSGAIFSFNFQLLRRRIAFLHKYRNSLNSILNRVEIVPSRRLWRRLSGVHENEQHRVESFQIYYGKRTPLTWTGLAVDSDV